MDNNTIFAEGLIVKKNENAPDFVLCNLSIKVEDFEKFLKANSNKGWVNLSVLMGKSGKPYAKLDTYEPKETPQQKAPEPIIEEDDLPF
jgi:hypothetical protein